MASDIDALAGEFLTGLRQVLGTPKAPIGLHEPELGRHEHELLRTCLDSTFVSSVGRFVDELEEMLASFTGAKHAVVVANGTAALQVALRLAGVKDGDEVLVPTLSFVATANAVVHAGGVPHFVDSSDDTMGLNPEALGVHLDAIAQFAAGGIVNRSSGRRIAAVVPMHAFGHPADLRTLKVVADRFRLPIVEDAAESLGSTRWGQHTGTFGMLGTLSFNGNKIVTTGGGGAILTNDTTLARRAKHLTTTAKRPHRWEFFHDEVAWNYRMPNLNAALGCAQMARLPDFIARKRSLAARYQAAFAAAEGIRFMVEPPDARSNYWLNTLCLVSPSLQVRDALLAAGNDAGFQCRPVWTLLHKLPMYSKCPRAALSSAERLEASLVNVPSSARLAPISVSA